MVYYRKGDRSKISQGKRSREQSPGKVPSVGSSFSSPCGARVSWVSWHVWRHTESTANQGNLHSFTFLMEIMSGFISCLNHDQYRDMEDISSFISSPDERVLNMITQLNMDPLQIGGYVVHGLSPP